MTPSQVEETARRRYNAIGDTFWSQQEIFDIIYAACLEACGETYCLERTYTSPTVAGTQGYDFPENAVAIKRVTWNGVKLTLIDMRDDDAITGMNQNTSDTGNPAYYWIWNRTIYLRPNPGSVANLKLWTESVQGAISAATTTLEIPDQHHMRLVNFVLSCMAAKDTNYNAAQYYLGLWEKDKKEIRKSMRKMKRADGFATVKDENLVVQTVIG